jgi:hypothetical protein
LASILGPLVWKRRLRWLISPGEIEGERVSEKMLPGIGEK